MTTKKTPSSTKKAAPKRSMTKAASTRPVAAAKPVTPPKPSVVSSIKPAKAAAAGAEASNELSKKELVERVATESGMKKGEARRAVEAILSVLRGAISDGTDIAAAPLGKIKIVRKKETPNGELAVLRVKLKDPNQTPKPKLAVADGDD